MPPEAVVNALQPWADVYAESRWLPLVLLTVHVLSLVAAAGVALAADRRVLRLSSGTSEGAAEGAAKGSADETASALLDALADTHPPVMRSLAVTLLSGAAMATADVGTYAGSTVFWSKMGLVVLLIVNGQLLFRAERRLAAERAGIAPLRSAAMRSVLLWGGIIVLGVAVSNQ
jgi:hypothetical protein